jgi:hypothetical protein
VALNNGWNDLKLASFLFLFPLFFLQFWSIHDVNIETSHKALHIVSLDHIRWSDLQSSHLSLSLLSLTNLTVTTCLESTRRM